MIGATPGSPCPFALLCISTLVCLSACGLLLQVPEEPGIAFFPATANQVLAVEQIPHVRFDIEVNKHSVEALFRIRDALGEVPGYCRWAGRTVYYHPQPALISGRRYVLSFEGTYGSRNGAEYVEHRIIPFYFEQRDRVAPCVVSSNPATGQLLAPDGAIRIFFSEPIDPSTLGRALVIRPDTPVATNWENEGTVLVIEVQREWMACACYTIRVTEELRGASGAALAEARDLVFWVQEDVESPRIVRVEPGANLPVQLFPAAGYDLTENVGLNDVLLIHFSEEMDTRRTEDALTIYPPVGIQCVWIDVSSLVVVPVHPLAANTEYFVDFADEATDKAGNTIEMRDSIRFVTVPGEIEVVTELVRDGIRLGSGEYSTSAAIEIRPYPVSTDADYELLLHFQGARFDSNNEKYAVQEAISLSCIFPDSGVPSPVVTGCSWMGDLTLGVTFSRLHRSTEARKIYYLLSILGGPQGVATEEGYRLKRDLEQLLVSAVE